ncbi:MAG: 3-dehydroquinate synthase [Clostridia bacterium]|nr:3-dehydroquinate synthase [Clostridia bacterium]
MQIPVSLGERSYEIVLERGCLRQAGQLLQLNRRVLIVTDDGVPAAYAADLAAQCGAPIIETVPQGEGSKSLAVLERLLTRMLRAGFTRRDCVAAVGGGVVGDLAGFAAACYMRGIAFYNLPTTVLSQVDSSVGGKTAVNLDGIKNVVGAFHQPQRVLIDPDVLATLPARQIANGLAEALKVALTSDPALFALFEADPAAQMDAIIARAVRIKADVVEQDETESGLRQILNFGHTIGHGIEAATGLYHGECVALGLLPMCSAPVRAKVLPILQRLGLPTEVAADPDAVYAALLHDKKAAADGRITIVTVPEIGSWKLETVEAASLRARIRSIIKEG